MTSLVLAFTVAFGAAEAASWVELRLGPYEPRVGGGREHDYYQLVYGGEHSLMKSLSYGRYARHGAGALGLSVEIGHWHIDAPTRVCRDARGEPQGCTPASVWSSKPGNDTTSLTLVPIGLAASYRLDALEQLTGVPLAPYARLGLEYTFWRNTVRGELSRGRDGAGAGGTLGVASSLGLAFRLDWLEPDVARRARSSSGIASSRIFCEVVALWADHFGHADRLDVSDTFVQGGLGIDFL